LIAVAAGEISGKNGEGGKSFQFSFRIHMIPPDEQSWRNTENPAVASKVGLICQTPVLG
jgi:hypothetical protein